jgi:hypothetical protein
VTAPRGRTPRLASRAPAALGKTPRLAGRLTAARDKAQRLPSHVTTDHDKTHCAEPPKIRPTSKHTLRALGGRRVILESFGPRAPVFFAIAAGRTQPVGAWLSQTELHHLVAALRKILP